MHASQLSIAKFVCCIHYFRKVDHYWCSLPFTKTWPLLLTWCSGIRSNQTTSLLYRSFTTTLLIYRYRPGYTDKLSWDGLFSHSSQTGQLLFPRSLAEVFYDFSKVQRLFTIVWQQKWRTAYNRNFANKFNDNIKLKSLHING